MRPGTVAIIVTGIVAILSSGSRGPAEGAGTWPLQVEGGTCRGPFAGRAPSREELEQVLAEHSRWAMSGGRVGKRADLCDAALEGSDLGEVNLLEANLSGAVLKRANLRQAGLMAANLTSAVLWSADLSQAILQEADLSGADLVSANLSGALLSFANLSGADLWRANLSGATLFRANLSGARLEEADLAFVVFELTPGSLPNTATAALARNLADMRYVETPMSLVQLREEFKKNGLRPQEREITFAIRRTQRRLSWERALNLESELPLARRLFDAVEATFNFVVFEMTSAYGMSPGRPLRVLVLLILLFALAYALALQDPAGGAGGVWLVWSPDRIKREEGGSEPVLLTNVAWPDGPGPRRILTWRGVLGFAVYFSLLSAFRIGWRELNVGSWILRLQSREYSIRATGWVRVVAGAQSLLSVYLVALWVLTYFGRPFD